MPRTYRIAPSILSADFARRGDEVTALARSASKAAALEPLGVRVVAGDLHDRAALQQAVEGQDVVYHVAGVVAARSASSFARRVSRANQPANGAK